VDLDPKYQIFSPNTEKSTSKKEMEDIDKNFILDKMINNINVPSSLNTSTISNITQFSQYSVDIKSDSKNNSFIW